MSEAEVLSGLPWLAGLESSELQALLDRSRRLPVPAGDTLLEQASPGDAMYVVLDGSFEVTRSTGDQSVFIATVGGGEVLGEMSLLSNTPRSANARALVDSEVLEITADEFAGLLARPGAVQAILGQVVARFRSLEMAVRGAEKLAALGTLSAGLMHELNNPSAAVTRSAQQLADSLAEFEQATRRVAEAGVAFPAVPSSDEGMLGALERSDRQEALEGWLTSRGVGEPWQLAPVLVAGGWTADRLQAAIGDTEATSDLVRWLALGSALRDLSKEIKTGAERISELIRAVRGYSYMDAAPVGDVDIQAGIEDTLVMLRHKFPDEKSVRREFADHLPKVEAYGGELNQVWTNLIDNALDACGEGGEIVVRTGREGEAVWVEVANTGPPITPDAARRIFEPFYTTKPQGKGTGLGLHITRTIVSKHGGELRFWSEDGVTTFRVTLPLRLPQRAG